MTPRLYAPDAIEGGAVRLAADEARHAMRVLRLRTGDEVRVFDGRGGEFAARLGAVSRDGVMVDVGARIEALREARTAVTLAPAVLKPEAMDALVRDAAMMGCAAVQPIVTARTNLSIATLERRGAVDRWHRIAVSSVKQSGRASVPGIRPPVTFETLLTLAASTPRYQLVEPSVGAPACGFTDLQAAGAPASALIASGPEGGWTREEVAAAAAAGFVAVTLGPLILRADAVPIVGLSVMLAAWKAFEIEPV
jgi:16S rRNA (uracil1498-N3)-methyltransferase